MTIRTEFLTLDDLERAADQVNDDYPGCDVYVGARAELVDKRVRRLEHVSLRSHTGTYVGNNGRFGSTPERAASWTEWGWWLAYLFWWDPHASAGEYRDADDFHTKTRNRFHDTRTDRQRQIARALADERELAAMA